ncbi:MAG: glutathione-disulfide reductase [Alphaproteobacteria bacterium]|nr:MAG: glutathione-disulfide reductase [Alphaproteobacteria bacterium]
MDYDYDLFVVGAGSGGVRASRIAAELGARVAIAEEYRVGGTCVIRGCIPKKLMTYAAHYREDFADAAGFGWDVGETAFDWSHFRRNMQGEVDRLNRLYIETLESRGVTIYPERAVLEDAHTLRVGDRRITADTILVATGGTPNLPHIPGVEHAITSNEVFHLPELPRRLLVVGGGYIAVEFAGIFNGLGSAVTLAYRRSPILRGFDMDLRTRLQAAMQDKGVEVRCETNVTAIEKASDGLDVTLTTGETLTVDQILFAIGRRPNSEGLGLERAGVELDPSGAICVDDYSRTNVPNIWAVGDVTDRIALTPVAIKEGHAFALTRFGGEPVAPDHRHVASAVFSAPPLATVGLTEDEALDKLGDVDVYESDFRPLKHVVAGRDERSYVKLLVDPESDRVVGMHMLGPDAPEIIQGFAVALKNGLTKAGLDRTVAIHPTSAEEFVLMAKKAR